MKQEPLTKSQLAILLGMSLRTLQRKLERSGLNIPRGLISPDCQIQIFVTLGYSSMATHLKMKTSRKTKNEMRIIQSLNLKEIETKDNNTIIQKEKKSVTFFNSL